MSRLKELINEIHRRSLWQVLLIYCGAALVAYQAVQALTEGLGLPQWFPALAIVLFIVGLPVVLATAFVQEVGPPTVAPAEPTALTEAEEAEAAAVHLQARRRHRFLTWRNAAATFVIVLAAWGVVATGWMLFGRANESATADERPSVAVLPLENRSGLEEDQYFTDGIHDEILTQLYKISGLSVRGRTSVMEYRDRTKNLRQIGAELNARYLMEGGVQRAGETVRINVQLIDAETDEHVFAENYDRELSVENLLAVQGEVALRIADALEATLTAAEREGIEARPTESSEAYDFYLRGNEYARQRYDPTDLLISVRMYRRAIELDPAFAIAYAALAQVQGWRSWYYGVAEALPEAREMLERARQLGPDSPEFHMAQGIFQYREREYSEAVQHFARTQELQPNNGEAISFMGFVRRRQARWNEAIIKQQEALQLDPRNHVSMYELGESYAVTRQYAEAEVCYNRAIALAPDVAEYYVAKALQRLLWKGNTDQAIEVIHEGFEAAGHLEVISQLVNLPNVGQHYQPLMRVLAAGYEETPDEVTLRESCLVCYLVLKATVHGQRAEHDLARAYYDSLRVTLAGSAERREGAYSEAQFWRYLGLAYAGLGQRDSAVAAGERSVSLLPVSEDALVGSDVSSTLAETYVMVGEYDAAIDRLDYLLSIPSRVSVPLLRVDPIYDALRDHPRFQALLEEYEQ